MSSTQVMKEHKMPEVAAIELTDRQEEILYQREALGKSREEISQEFERVDGTGNINVRGVESHLSVARKKRRVAVNTIYYVAQMGGYEYLNLDIPHPDDIDFPSYVDEPEGSVDHNETCLFERQKNILCTIAEHDNDNRHAVKNLLTEDEVTEIYNRFKQDWQSGGSEELSKQLSDLIDGNPSEFAELREQLEHRVIDDSNLREVLLDEIHKRTTVWDEDDLSKDSAIELFIKYSTSKRAYEKKYTTLRQYKYYRLPEKLEDCYRTAVLPEGT